MGSLPDSLKACPAQDEFYRQPKNPNARDASKRKTSLRQVHSLANSDPSSEGADLPGKGTPLSSFCARLSEFSVYFKSDPGNPDVLEVYFMWLSWNQLALNHSFQGCVWHIVSVVGRL